MREPWSQGLLYIPISEASTIEKNKKIMRNYFRTDSDQIQFFALPKKTENHPAKKNAKHPSKSMKIFQKTTP